ncbi:MAG TPA: Z1 domain-containing protein [Steroidobacter sp.]|uniref:Z1 domain-containing protein n=1 Tax=Steroidobacter sp. TaxID=1978227 RepID=UPI002EDA2D7A
MTTKTPDFAKLAEKAAIKNQYQKQLNRLTSENQQTDCIDDAVKGALDNLTNGAQRALVIYGDPQSGKTEMMICLTARLLDHGFKTIVHLMNDSVDLLIQNLERFKLAGLAPAPRNASDLANSPLVKGHHVILFCKKNAKDLTKLIDSVKKAGPVIVVDDEADYATPNAKINQREKTRINELVERLIGAEGRYIGVTATPARLNLNKTFNNSTETWVNFRSHNAYTGQDTFFPLDTSPAFRLNLINSPGTPEDARQALARFLVTAAYLNLKATRENRREQNYSFLVHTSGKTDDHRVDRTVIEKAMTALISQAGKQFSRFAGVVHKAATDLFPNESANDLTGYVIANASRSAFVVLNSQRDRKSAGDKPTVPTCPFTVIIGGNIVSRGVTFPNLLSMFFTRDVKTKLQQDTYIQRARMFGSRNAYLPHFELTIPRQLYADWHRCFVFHRLALQTMRDKKVPPVWIGDPRISIAASSSIDRGTVDLNKGEMSFEIFDTTDLDQLDAIVRSAPKDLNTLRTLAARIGTAMPEYLLKYLESDLRNDPGMLAIHASSSIKGYRTADQDTISRRQGFIGTPQLEEPKFGRNIKHHIKILHNDKGHGRVFYKNLGGVQFAQNNAV